MQEEDTSSSPLEPPEEQTVQLKLHPDDVKDKVLGAIVRSLLRTKNTPASPKELASFIIHWNLTKMSGATPHATVSSRISQHFKRCATAKPKRKPILGQWNHQGARKLRYYIADLPFTEPSPERLSQNIEMFRGVPHIVSDKKPRRKYGGTPKQD